MTQIVATFLLALGAWTVSFDEDAARLTLDHLETGVQISGELSFSVDGKPWKIGLPRDAVRDRLALIDPASDDVQGYVSFQTNGDRLEALVYHRTRQFYSGVLKFNGDVLFRDDSFPCRTIPDASERVLPFATGTGDSATNDSLFAREEDLALQFRAANLTLTTKANADSADAKAFVDGAQYGVAASGAIQEASQAAFAVEIDKNYYQKRWVPYYAPIDRKRCPSPPTGWMSWNTYFDTATADDNLAEARVGQKLLQPFGLEIWSIESWQGNSDQLPVSNFYNLNLEANEKQFPKGMKQLADDIRALGFKPGLWTAPFGTGSKEFYDAHKDWFLHDQNGEPLHTWNGVYTIDPSNDEVVEHLRKIHEIASKDWGYEFFKIDGMSGSGSGYCAHFFERPDVRAQFKNPNVEAPFERCVRALREGIGDDRIFLACQGHFTGPEAAFADAARTGADVVHWREPVKWGNVLNQAGRTHNQVFTNNVVFFSDPDTLLVTEAGVSMEEARVATTIVALPGQTTFFGDKLATLAPERVKLLQQTLPVCDVRPGALYPFFKNLPIWDLKVGKPFGNWDVVALFNWSDEAASVGFDFDEIGLEAGTYVAYEFWTETFLGENDARFDANVPPHAVRLLAVTKKRDVPQFLSSDRHVSQGAVDLLDSRWDAEKNALSQTLRLVAEHETNCRYLIPAGYRFVAVESASDAAFETALENDGTVLRVGATAPVSEDVAFRLTFERANGADDRYTTDR